MSPRSTPAQPSLFELPEPSIEPMPSTAEQRELAARLPVTVRLGAMSWSFPGWRGLVYRPDADARRLAGQGLAAYAQNPLFGAVEVDRSYYEPLPADEWRRLAAQVPAGFRFAIKAHEDCTARRFPDHARQGARAGADNPRYLDAAYAADAVVGPAVEGLGDKLGAIVFQCPPQDAGSPAAFARRLGQFLCGLPTGPTYAVELRNRELMTPAYAAALADAGAVHCHSAWSRMPTVLDQARSTPPEARRPLVIRWLLRRGEDYAAARARFLPFDRVQAEDPASLDSIARLATTATRHGVPVLVLISNKAEGCAPESILRLARAMTDLLDERRG